MAGFDPKYPKTYQIAYLIVTPFSVLLGTFWGTLNPALENSLKDIAIKQFFKLLVLLCIIFL